MITPPVCRTPAPFLGAEVLVRSTTGTQADYENQLEVPGRGERTKQPSNQEADRELQIRQCDARNGGDTDKH